MIKGQKESDIASSDKKIDDKYIYRDLSRSPNDGSYLMPLLSSMSSAAVKVQKLPPKLYTILSTPEFSHIITWMPHGRTWKVLDIKGFQDEVMPGFFEYTKYESFVRLVNAWGFKRVPSGPDRNSFFHEQFLRGVPHLLGKMRRMTNKDKRFKVRREDMPDFYNISERYPLPSVSISDYSSSHTDSAEQRPRACSGLRLLSSVSDEVSVSSDLSQESSSQTPSAPIPCQNAMPSTVGLAQFPGNVIGAPFQNIHGNARQYMSSHALNAPQQMQQWPEQTTQYNAMKMRVKQLEQEVAMYRAQMKVSQLEKELAMYRKICGNVPMNDSKEASVS